MERKWSAKHNHTEKMSGGKQATALLITAHRRIGAAQGIDPEMGQPACQLMEPNPSPLTGEPGLASL